MSIDYEKVIPFYDVDPMRITWHGNYVKYLEEARCAYLESRHMSYYDMNILGYAFPIVELKIKYIHPCHFGQKIIVRTELEDCENFMTFKYEILDAKTGQKLCRAQTKQMCVVMETEETLFEIPEIVLKQLGLR
ncbi:MAG: acyl-CoA thioesterase [Alphaproteobacteria bacterium]|nr:acyl-CoA thioesterase [Alphaproteobacteria bacterium]